MPRVKTEVRFSEGVFRRGVMTVTKTQNRDLEITLETALLLAGPETSIPELAERIYDSEPELVAQLQRAWMVERFTWLLYRRHRRHEETAGRAGDGERDGAA